MNSQGPPATFVHDGVTWYCIHFANAADRLDWLRSRYNDPTTPEAEMNIIEPQLVSIVEDDRDETEEENNRDEAEGGHDVDEGGRPYGTFCVWTTRDPGNEDTSSSEDESSDDSDSDGDEVASEEDSDENEGSDEGAEEDLDRDEGFEYDSMTEEDSGYETDVTEHGEEGSGPGTPPTRKTS